MWHVGRELPRTFLDVSKLKIGRKTLLRKKFSNPLKSICISNILRPGRSILITIKWFITELILGQNVSFSDNIWDF